MNKQKNEEDKVCRGSCELYDQFFRECKATSKINPEGKKCETTPELFHKTIALLKEKREKRELELKKEEEEGVRLHGSCFTCSEKLLPDGIGKCYGIKVAKVCKKKGGWEKDYDMPLMGYPD